jgi:D-aminopeptidase
VIALVYIDANHTVAVANSSPEGSVGAGTGMVAYGFKGGIGTASRTLDSGVGGYTVGALLNANQASAPI